MCCYAMVRVAAEDFGRCFWTFSERQWLRRRILWLMCHYLTLASALMDDTPLSTVVYQFLRAPTVTNNSNYQGSFGFLMFAFGSIVAEK